MKKDCKKQKEERKSCSFVQEEPVNLQDIFDVSMDAYLWDEPKVFPVYRSHWVLHNGELCTLETTDLELILRKMQGFDILADFLFVCRGDNLPYVLLKYNIHSKNIQS